MDIDDVQNLYYKLLLYTKLLLFKMSIIDFYQAKPKISKKIQQKAKFFHVIPWQILTKP